MHRVIFVLGLGAGYVLGARAGRARYEQIQTGARRLATSSQVQSAMGEIQHALDTATPRVRRGSREAASGLAQLSVMAYGRATDGIQALAGAVSGGIHDARARLADSAEDLQDRVTLQTDDLRKRSEELRLRGEEQLDELRQRSEELRQRSEEQLDQVRRRVDEQIERSRDHSADGFVRVGSARDDALDVWEDDDASDERLDSNPPADGPDAK